MIYKLLIKEKFRLWSAAEFNQYNSRPLRLEQFELPAIKDIQIRMVDFKPPKFKHIKSYLEKYNDALEITIVTEGPIPPRAATPVLYIAGAKISYYTIGKKKMNIFSMHLNGKK